MLTLDRLPGPIRRWLYAGGTRQDRLRDPDAVVAALDLRPGMVVGDLGPGAGHFTLRLARAVEPDGVVYALDASQSILDDLRRAADDRGITTLRWVLVRRDRLEIPVPQCRHVDPRQPARTGSHRDSAFSPGQVERWWCA